MTRWFSQSITALLLTAAAALLAFGKRPTDFRLPNGTPVGHRTVITFWEKWNGREAQAMQDLVDRFNATQSDTGIFVNFISMSQINQKMLIATAGGDPPDICGLFAKQIAPFAADHALEPLDELRADGTITDSTYKPYVWRICAPQQPDGSRRLFGVAATPSVCALYWNKDLFAQAGLDPEKPPQTIEELDAFADRLTMNTPQRTQAGFLPNEPGWWDYAWGIYWGNTLYDRSTGRFNIDTPAQIAAYQWYQNYSTKYPAFRLLDAFHSASRQFNSPQNSFIDGKVAMVLQGPYFATFIAFNNPQLVGHYGVAPMPLPTSLHLPPGAITLGDLDVWTIPRGAAHKKEALQVLRFFTQRENMEYLCRQHAKPSPLTDVSAAFLAGNPNPYIAVFEEIMVAPTVIPLPDSPVWDRTETQLVTSIQNMWRDPEKYPVAPTLTAAQKTIDGYVNQYNGYAKIRNKTLLPP